MRWMILAASTTLAVAPALANGPQCAMPGPVVMAAADPPPATPTAPAPSKPTPTAAPADKTAQVVPPGLSNLPFVRRVAVAGATLLDLGMSHGLHLAAARHGDEFRVFSILPAGDATVEGAPIELSPAQLRVIAAGNVTQVGRQAGFVGYFVRSGPSFQVFYETPDGLALVPGVLRDAQGKNITRTSRMVFVPSHCTGVEPSQPMPRMTLPKIDRRLRGAADVSRGCRNGSGSLSRGGNGIRLMRQLPTEATRPPMSGGTPSMRPIVPSGFFHTKVGSCRAACLPATG